jgi:hypothetical protein
MAVIPAAPTMIAAVPVFREAEEAKGAMSRRTIILFVWLIVGAAASGQRGYFSTSNLSCSTGATMAATIVAGPLNYLGVDPMVSCNWPQPST